jgi:hypothetical protein
MKLNDIKKKTNVSRELFRDSRTKEFEKIAKEKTVDAGKDLKTRDRSVRVHGYTINPNKRYNVVITDYFAVQDEKEVDWDTGVVYGKEEVYEGKDVIKLLEHYSHKLNTPDFDFDAQEVHYG